MTLKGDKSYLQIDLDTADCPLPPDSKALSQWLGLKHNVLWWLVLKRKEMYKQHRIPKGRGKYRILHEPFDQLKYAQTMVLENVLKKFPVPEHIGAYEEGRGVKYTTQRHSKHAVVLELDIKGYFDNTTRKFVREFFYSISWPREPAKLVSDLLTYPVKHNLSVVPQGAPSSPTLCNLIGNQRFDQQILTFLKSVHPGWVYTRYSDNLIISHPESRLHEEVSLILQQVKEIVKGGGYLINPEKVKIMRANHPEKPQHLLGLTVNTKPNIAIAQYKKLRAQVDRAFKHGFKAVEGLPESVTTVEDTISHLTGTLNYFLYINPSAKLQKLKEKFDTAVQKEKEAVQKEKDTVK